jgi:hypothetical protein
MGLPAPPKWGQKIQSARYYGEKNKDQIVTQIVNLKPYLNF